MFQQDWAQEWTGWRELSETATDAEFMQAAARFDRVAQANRPVQMKSNATRLDELTEAGLTLIPASPHGVNNCLIDSVLLGLIAVGVLDLPQDINVRRRVCAACRAYLMTEHNVGSTSYLDAHWDVPRILHYFLQITWPQATAVKVHLYDRLEQEELGANVQGELNVIEYTTEGDASTCHELHIFNHTNDNGFGYHFDLLWPLGTAWAHGLRTALPPLAHDVQAWIVAGDQTQIVRHALSTRCQAVRTDAEWVNDTRTHLRVALDAASAEPPTDATALERWKNVGFVPDKPVGEERSHTLISALWNSLRACGVLPCNQGQRTVEAENIMRQCRAALVGQNVCNTLNWHRDGRAVVSWLLRHAGVQPKQNLQLQCADRRKLEEIAPSISSLDVHRVGPTASEATTLRIYAHSTVTGKEWWYEALNPQQDEKPSTCGRGHQRKRSRSASARRK